MKRIAVAVVDSLSICCFLVLLPALLMLQIQFIILIFVNSSVIYVGIAKQELMAMLEEDELKDAILLVFANKQDQRGALNSRHVSKYFLSHYCSALK